MIDLVVIPVLTGYERAAALVESLYAQTEPPGAILIVNNGIGRFESPALLERDLRVVNPGRNLGVGASWNVGLRADDAHRILFLNDDVLVSRETLAVYNATLDAAEDDVAIVGPFEHTYAAWCCRRNLLLTNVGELDEQFWPAYFEDDDLRYRVLLAGLKEQYVDNDALGLSMPTTATTSADLGEDGREWLRRTYDKNRRLYDAKWGAQPPHELYSRPYDPASIDVERGGRHYLLRSRR